MAKFDAARAGQGALLGFLAGRREQRDEARLGRAEEREERGEVRADKKSEIEKMLADARMDALSTELELNQEALIEARRGNDPARVAELEEYQRELRALTLESQRALADQRSASAEASRARAAGGGGGRGGTGFKEFDEIRKRLVGKRKLLEDNLELAESDPNVAEERLNELRGEINALDVQIAAMDDMVLNPIMEAMGLGPQATPQPEATEVQPSAPSGVLQQLLSAGTRGPAPSAVAPKATQADINAIPGGLEDPLEAARKAYGSPFLENSYIYNLPEMMRTNPLLPDPEFFTRDVPAALDPVTRPINQGGLWLLDRLLGLGGTSREEIKEGVKRF